MVAMHRDFLRGLRGERSPETTGADYLKTLELVHRACASVRLSQAINLREFARMEEKQVQRREKNMRWR